MTTTQRTEPRREAPVRLLYLALLAATLLFAAGCGDSDSDSAQSESTTAAGTGADSTAAPNGFVGTVSGTDAFVAVVPGAEETVVYVCDGESEIALWLRGASDDPDAIELTGDDGVGVSAHFDGTGYTGEVTLADGSVHEFTATVAGPDAGLWVTHGEEAVEADVAAAWVLDDDGQERGAFFRTGRFQRTPRFNRGGLRVGRTTVRVSKIIAPSNVITPQGIIAPSNIVAPNNVVAPPITVVASVSTGGSGGEDRIRDEAPKLEPELKELEGGGGG